MMESDSKKEKEEQIKKDVKEIEQTIKDSSKELEDIQNACSHPKESVKINNVNPEGSSDMRNVCGLCSLVLGYPTKDEMDEWTGINKDKDSKNKG